MKTMLVSVGVLMFLLLVGYFVVVNYAVNEYNSIDSNLKELVGEQIIIKDDTLMVIDYSILNNTVTLDDGREVNVGLVKKLMEDK